MPVEKKGAKKIGFDPKNGDELSIVGVLESPGLTGGQWHAGRKWTLRFSLKPWRTPGGELQDEPLHVERETGGSVLKTWMHEFKTHQVIRISVRWGTEVSEDPWGQVEAAPLGCHARLIGKPLADSSDEELNGLASQLAHIEIDAPPFPKLVWDSCAWAGEIELPSWSPGRVALTVSAEGPRLRPTKAQRNAYSDLVANEEARNSTVVAAAFEHFRAESRRRKISDPDEFRKRIGLVAVHVHGTSRGGHAYLGFEFECPWDPEHGLGVAAHRKRVVAVGSADVALGEFDDE